jgi:hypothetical protein
MVIFKFMVSYGHIQIYGQVWSYSNLWSVKVMVILWSYSNLNIYLLKSWLSILNSPTFIIWDNQKNHPGHHRYPHSTHLLKRSYAKNNNMGWKYHPNVNFLMCCMCYLLCNIFLVVTFCSTRSGGKPANMRGYMISYPLAIQDVWLANWKGLHLQTIVSIEGKSWLVWIPWDL